MVVIFIIVIFKTTNLAPKKVANISSTVVLLVLVIICAALLLVFGTIANGKYFLHSCRFLNCKLLLSQDICNPDRKSLQNTVLNIMITVACLGIASIVISWAFIACRFCKLKGEFEIH